jgi:uncharacterized protein YutE (UPF0331/DUF86 family)
VKRLLFAEKAGQIERQLAHVASALPDDPEDFLPETPTSAFVILHLWQAVQQVINLAMSLCASRGLAMPGKYREAFELLAADGVIDQDLAERLARAAGFRNAVAHTYLKLDMDRVYRTAKEGPADLRAFLNAVSAVIRP